MRVVAQFTLIASVYGMNIMLPSRIDPGSRLPLDNLFFLW